MADLMSASYTISDLQNKYGDFSNPLLQVIVNGKDLVSSSSLPVESARIRLSTMAAGTAELWIGPVYDQEKQAFDSDIKSSFTLGSVVEIGLGYKSSAEKVFKGYVALLGAQFGKKHYIKVTLMDARRLMMKSGSRQVLHDVKNYSDAVTDILKDYSALGDASVDSTQDNLESPVSQTQDDYHFIVNELIRSGKADREFFVFGDTIYFRTPRKVTSPVLSIKPEDALLELSVEEEYENLTVEVIGYDPKKQETLTASKQVQKNSSSKSVGPSSPKLTLTDAGADTQEKANNRAEAIAEALGYQKQSGSGLAIGLPQIVPGRYLKIEDLESDFGDHKFYITDVCHEISGTQFLTRFDIRGWQ